MGQVTKEELITAMHTNPTTEREIGFNSALIFVLKKSIGLTDVVEPQLTPNAKILKMAFNNLKMPYFDKLVQSDIDVILECVWHGHKLETIKRIKDATGLGLKESKDIADQLFILASK